MLLCGPLWVFCGSFAVFSHNELYIHVVTIDAYCSSDHHIILSDVETKARLMKTSEILGTLSNQVNGRFQRADPVSLQVNVFRQLQSVWRKIKTAISLHDTVHKLMP